MKIFLVGFMGCGKSTIAGVLAQRLGLHAIDLDTLIMERESKSIPEIFRVSGESAFRDCERKALLTLAFKSSCVIATGGGVVVDDRNMDFMKEAGTVVYLRTSWSTICDRVGSGEGRPLAANREQMKKLLELRAPKYENADIVVDTDGKTPQEVADLIIEELKRL